MAHSYYRKRAKTDDEKEQRRIERVLRNRQAAQSSRERKRQEVEKLEGEKCAIEEQNRLLKERLLAVEHEKFKLAQQVAKMAAEMSAFKNQRRSRESITPSSPTSSYTPSPNFEAEFLHQQIVKQELQDLEQYTFLPTPEHSVEPSTTSFSSPASSSYSRSPSPSELGLGFHAIAASSDMAQHPAAMLCGLQCQSEVEKWLALTQNKVQQLRQQIFLTQLLFLMLISAVYSHLLHPLHLIFNSLRTGSRVPSERLPKT